MTFATFNVGISSL